MTRRSGDWKVIVDDQEAMSEQQEFFSTSPSPPYHLSGQAASLGAKLQSPPAEAVSPVPRCATPLSNITLSG